MAGRWLRVRYRPRPLVVILLASIWLLLEPLIEEAWQRATVPVVAHRSSLAGESVGMGIEEHRVGGKTAEDARTALGTTVEAEPSTTTPPVVTNPPVSAELETEWALSKKQQALALIHYPWQKLGYEIVFLGPRTGYRAMTISDRKRIEVYVRPGDDLELLAFDLAHEIGHAFDLERNNGTRRNHWRELRGISESVPWFGCNRCPDYQTPAGDFAETFALLLLGPENYHSRIALAPTPEEMPDLADFCEIEVTQRPAAIAARKTQ